MILYNISFSREYSFILVWGLFFFLSLFLLLKKASLFQKIKIHIWNTVNKYSVFQKILNSNKNQRFHQIYDIRELISQEFHDGKFNRYDIIVRLLAIENFYGKNNFGFNLYRKMQANRMDPARTDDYERTFKKLILSYKEHGYKESSEITLTNDLKLEDGSHRIALALFHNYQFISCQVLNYSRKIHYGIDSFIEYGFSKNDITNIKKKFDEIKHQFNIPFVCILWSPAEPYFDEITEFLKEFSDIRNVKDYSFDATSYNNVLQAVYAVDDIESWKIKLKYDNTPTKSIMKMRVITMQINHPQFRVKVLNKKTLSTYCEHIKKVIRTNYKSKIANYYHDIIIHIGDNYFQNEYLAHLFDSIQNSNNSYFTGNVLDFFFKDLNYENISQNRIVNNQLDLLKKICKDNDIPTNEICVVGSTVLALFNIRTNHDIDFITTSKNRARFGTKSKKFSNNIELVAETWAQSKTRAPFPDDELIFNSDYFFWHNGLKFAKIPLVFERKLWQSRDKDVKDISLILSFLKDLRNSNYNERS